MERSENKYYLELCIMKSQQFLPLTVSGSPQLPAPIANERTRTRRASAAFHSIVSNFAPSSHAKGFLSHPDPGAI